MTVRLRWEGSAGIHRVEKQIRCDNREERFGERRTASIDSIDSLDSIDELNIKGARSVAASTGASTEITLSSPSPQPTDDTGHAQSSSASAEVPWQNRPAVAVDVVILTVREGRLEVVLVKRDHPPFEGLWSIPGGFVRYDESLEDAAKRKLSEVTGVGDVYLEQLYTFGDPGRDPRMRVITVVYYALIRADQLRLPEEPGSPSYQFCWAYDLPPLAFDHEEIMRYSLLRLRGKLEYTTIGFQLLAHEFTMSELQDVYQAILNRTLDKRNFRKKLLMMRTVEPTSHTRMVGPHRPAQLFRFNPHAAQS